MPTFSLPVILRSLGLLLAAGLQIWSGYWRLLLTQRIALYQYDSATFWLAAIDVLLGVASGVLITIILFPKADHVSAKTPTVVIALGSVLPAIALVFRFSAAMGVYNLPLGQFLIADWAINSGIPPLWLGSSIVALIYRLKS